MTDDYERRLNRVLDYIHDNPAGDLSLGRSGSSIATGFQIQVRFRPMRRPSKSI